jgi:NTE family protein
VQQRSIFDGIPREDLRRVLRRAERRSFPAGSVVLAEGDSPYETYVVKSGAADVYVADAAGEEHRIGYVTPGGTLGEMSMLTGEPAVGTVRAATDLDVYAIGEQDFDVLAEQFPVVYRNLGAILSQRLDRSNRRSLSDETGHVTVLRDWGAPPLLGYAIASSMAWHLRAPVLLLVLDETPPEELRQLAHATPRPRLRTPRGERELERTLGQEPKADVLLMTRMLDFVGATLTARMEDFHPAYEHVLVQVKGDAPALSLPARTVHLAGAGGPAGDGAALVVRGWNADNGYVGPRNGAVRVPSLDAAAHDALREGCLPARGAAGSALGWVARDLCGLKVGLALGGGSAKGYAHLGVLRALLRAGLPIDCIAGTSIGAAVAAFYALGLDLDESIAVWDKLGAKAFRPRPSTRSLLSMWSLSRGVRAACGEARIEDLHVPLAITAADVATGEEVVFREGLVWSAVLASMAIPGVFPAQRIGRHMLVDGGVFHPVPTGVVADMGADLVVGVRLSSATETRVEAEAVEPKGRSASIFYTIMRSIEMMQARISATNASAATILIAPIETDVQVERVGLRRWKAAQQYVPLGEAAAEEALPRLAAALPWMRPSA